MTKSVINLGTSPNDRTGDTLRDAGTKVNSNFSELYTALGNGTTLGIAVTGATTGQVLKHNGTTFVPASDLNTDAVTSVNTLTGAVVLVTDDIAEDGSPVNLWFTNARARSAVSATSGVAYNSSTGVITLSATSDDLTEGTTNLFYTSSRFNTSFGQKTTNDLAEGNVNKYFTNTLARGAISVSGDLAYDSATGVLSFTDAVTLTNTVTLTNKTLTSPTLTTPALGVATATSINGLTVTTTTGTLTLVNGSTLVTAGAFSTTLTATATTDVTLPTTGTLATLAGTETLTNKTITAPKIDLINDANGNQILGTSATTSAVDYLVVKNGIGAGVPPHFYADGSSTNIGIHIQPKGTGLLTISDGADFNKGIRFRSSSSASSAVTLIDAVSTAGRVITLPDATDTLVGRATTDTLSNKTAGVATATSTAASLGYLGIPQNSQAANYTTVIGDSGKHIYVTTTSTVTIDSNANVAYPIGTTIGFIADTGVTVTIAITSDTMYLAGPGTTGSRTLAAFGMATAVKVTATSWFISGYGLT